MRVVIHSPAFYPMIGGLEAFAAMLAGGLHQRGHEVVVLCQAELEADMAEPFPFKVVRRASLRGMARWMNRADAVIHAQISLRGLVPWLAARRPLLVSHQTWLKEPEGRPLTSKTRLKRLACGLAVNVACSAAVGRELGLPHQVIPNPYDEALFKVRSDVPRDRDLLFVGRLVSDKGADLLITAASKLVEQGRAVSLTITGSGAEEARLKQLAQESAIGARTLFTGALRGEELARLMNAHRVLAVPSRWEEPFGIVALEGAASGCVVVASDQGGLPEAVGPCGLTFRSGDAQDLSRCLRAALESRQTDTQGCASHLLRHRRGDVVVEYEQVLLGMIRSD